MGPARGLRDIDPEEFELPELPPDVAAAVTVLGRRPVRVRVDEQGRLDLQWSFLGSVRLEGSILTELRLRARTWTTPG